jgi:hypothetical protein
MVGRPRTDLTIALLPERPEGGIAREVVVQQVGSVVLTSMVDTMHGARSKAAASKHRGNNTPSSGDRRLRRMPIPRYTRLQSQCLWDYSA